MRKPWFYLLVAAVAFGPAVFVAKFGGSHRNWSFALLIGGGLAVLIALVKAVLDYQRLVEVAAANAAVGICNGCGQPIAEGQHYLKVRVGFDTRMPNNWRPRKYIQPTAVSLKLHDPSCFMSWAKGSALIADVYR